MILGLAGLAGSGKTTIADELVAAHGFERRLSLADPLRVMLAELDPIVGWDPDVGPVRWNDAMTAGYRPARARWPEMRRLLQRLGTEAGRGTLGEDVWVEHLMGRIGPLEDVVVDDVRFPNEVAAIQAAGGVVCWVERPGVEKMGHPSEQLDPALCDLARHNVRSVRGVAGSIAHAVKGRDRRRP